MNTQVANTTTQDQPPTLSVLHDMAAKFRMQPAAFEATVRAQCSPAPKKGEAFRPLSKEEFAAFLLVAREYDLNPLTREIFAYPKRGGGVVPIVSVDGWVNLINSHPACDGWDFKWEEDDRGRPIFYTCIMHRKDRSHPVVVTEFLSECWRDTDPWKMPHRMLRHKSLIQCARYAFGFAGIYDEDEGQRIIAAEATEAPAPRPVPPRPGPRPSAAQTTSSGPQRGNSGGGKIIEGEAIVERDEPKPEANADEAAPEPESEFVSGSTADDYLAADLNFVDELRDRLFEANDVETIEEIWTNLDPMARYEGDEKTQNICLNIKLRRIKMVEEKGKAK